LAREAGNDKVTGWQPFQLSDIVADWTVRELGLDDVPRRRIGLGQQGRMMPVGSKATFDPGDPGE